MSFGWNRVVAVTAVAGALAWATPILPVVGAGVTPPAAPPTAGVSPGVAAAPDDSFDDPKLSRELVIPRASRAGVETSTNRAPSTPRTSAATPRPPAPATPPAMPLPLPLPPASAPPPVVVPAAAPPTGGSSHTPASPRAAAPHAAVAKSVSKPEVVAFAAPVVDAPSIAKVVPAAAPAGVVAKPSPPEAPSAKADAGTGTWPFAPRMKLAYRRFPFTRLGATSTTNPPALSPGTSQSFESLSLDLYPISWYLRVGLSTQLGWESGQFDRSGDYFLAESASVGFQIPGRFTPFAEVLAGAGYMRRIQADTSVPTAYWQLGVDAGVEIYFANRAYASVAVGYLHPGNLFVMQQSLMSVKADTWSLKIGIGI